MNFQQGIYDADIGKMLGAQFSLEILREIFSVLKSQFTHQNLPIANILKGIVTNSQMPIVSVMMNAEDKLGKYSIKLKTIFLCDIKITNNFCEFFFFDILTS